MKSAVLHGEGAGGEGLFGDGFELRAEAGFVPGEDSEAFDGGAADYIRWIVAERHQQSGDTEALGAGLSDACGYEAEVGASSPVVAFSLAEQSDQGFGVRMEQMRMLLSYAACGVGGSLAEGCVIG